MLVFAADVWPKYVSATDDEEAFIAQGGRCSVECRQL